MKNILITRLPTSINVFGKEIEIYTDFKKWIEFELEHEKDIKSSQIIMSLLSLVKDKRLVNEQNLEEVVNQLLIFYNCGEKTSDENSSKNKSSKIMYSFDKDQYLVYSDFIRFYNIDLSEASLHWWKFKKLFVELPLSSSVKEAMKFRSIKITSKMTQEQKNYYLKMKKLYSLEKDMTKTKKQAQIGSILFSGMNIKHDKK